MPNVNTSEFRSGLKLIVDGDPCSIIENEFVKPGKGQAFVRAKFRNLRSGRVIERTFRSGESVEAADVLEVSLQFIYSDGDMFHFMDEETFEQHAAAVDAVAGAARWLKEQDACTITLWNGTPIAVTPAQLRDAPDHRDRARGTRRHRERCDQAGDGRDRSRRQGPAVHRAGRARQDRYPHRRVRRARPRLSGACAVMS